ncbi:MAG TPA: Gfo/Idh/MocA family oxidoreductase [Kiritimatiellia bacterium]|nr:Gfo/Idh/MocA family oxidoreductase [Kiritimatiellia bacterium]HRU71575.1 Gfo/Idh/MocA family oxidoreductase [Kiritimatiellia bacterium]
MGKTLRVGIVGGGNDSFIGDIHRAAIEQCGRLELVCGAFGSTRQSSFETGKRLKLPTRRSYGTYRDMFRREATLPAGERMDFVSVLAPNAMHYPVAMSAIDAGFSVFSEKPFTCNLDEGLNLTRKQQASGLAYGIAMVYQGYPALRMARHLLLEEKAIGTIRKIVSRYPMGWMAQRLETAGNKQASWRTDPRRCGPAGCLADLGIHCFYLSEWLSGLAVSEVCADLRPTVAGRILDDDCSVLVRFTGGARGVFLASQVATGRRDGLAIELAGDRGALMWSQCEPDRLILRDVDGSERVLTEGIAATGGRSGPCPFGSDAAYIAALAATYAAFADYYEAHQSKKGAAPAARGFMSVEDGLRAVVFVDAVLKNCAVPEEPAPPPAKWTPVIVPPTPEL